MNFKNLFIEKASERPLGGNRGSVAKTVARRQLNEELLSPVFIFSWWIRPGARLWRCGPAGSIQFFIGGKILALNNLKGQRLSLTLSSRVCSTHSLCVSDSKMRNNTRALVACAEAAHLKANGGRKKVCQRQDRRGPFLGDLLSSVGICLLMFSVSLKVTPGDPPISLWIFGGTLYIQTIVGDISTVKRSNEKDFPLKWALMLPTTFCCMVFSAF